MTECCVLGVSLRRILPLLLIAALVAAGGVWYRTHILRLDGIWVVTWHDLPMMKLTILTRGLSPTGSLTKPVHFTVDGDGDFVEVGTEQITLPMEQIVARYDSLEFTIDGDRYRFQAMGPDQATLVSGALRPWTLRRVPQDTEVKVTTHLPAAVYSDEILALRQELEQMVGRDQSTRKALDHRGAEAEDLKNAAAVLRIFEKYGWVGRSLAGKDAAHNFWLLVQHQTPGIQRKLLPFLERSAMTGESSMSDYAYLYDRVQVGLGKPQRWGTQAVCEFGKPVLAPVEEPETLEERRARLYLPPVSTYLSMDYLVRFCSQASQ